jgi:hypothetical protein
MKPDRTLIRRILYICFVLGKETAAITARVEGPHLLITDLGRHSVARLSALPHWSSVLWYNTTILKQAGSDDCSFAITDVNKYAFLVWNPIACGYKKHLSWHTLTHVQISQENEGIWNHKNLLFREIRRGSVSVCRCSPPNFAGSYFKAYRCRWLRGLRRGSAAARLLVLRVRIPRGAWMSLLSVVYCAGRGL